jgi:hypothetical protein
MDSLLFTFFQGMIKIQGRILIYLKFFEIRSSQIFQVKAPPYSLNIVLDHTFLTIAISPYTVNKKGKTAAGQNPTAPILFTYA